MGELIVKNRIVYISIFLLSVCSLLISLKLFWNLGIFVDKYNLSPDIVNGGNLWLVMDWLRLLLLFLVCILSWLNIFRKQEKS